MRNDQTERWEGEQIVPDRPFYELPGDHVARYMFAKSFVNEKIVLDVPCGAGYGTAFLSEHGAQYVFGVDISTTATDFGQRHYCRNNLSFAVNDALSLAIKTESIDVVVSFEGIEHMSTPREFLREVARCLNDDGLLLISTPNAKLTSPIWKTPFNRYHKQEFKAGEFKRLLDDFFENVDLLGETTTSPRWKRMENRYRIANFVHPYFTRKFPRLIKDFYLGISVEKERIPFTDFIIDEEDVERSWCLVAVARIPKRY